MKPEDREKAVRAGLQVGEAPKLWPINGPVMDAFNYVVTFADGMGGVKDDSLARFFKTPKGRGLTPEMRRRCWLWVPELVQVMRRHQRETMESKTRNK